jgi:hypothetical protein
MQSSALRSSNLPRPLRRKKTDERAQRLGMHTMGAPLRFRGNVNCTIALRRADTLGIKATQERVTQMNISSAIRLAGAGLCVAVCAACIGVVGFGLMFIF